MGKRKWFWNAWKKKAHGGHRENRSRMTSQRTRLLLLEFLEPRQLLSGMSVADMLARATPNPHASGDQPTDSSQMVVLSSYTPAALPPDPGISPDITEFIAGLQQIESSVAANPNARPSYWGESIVAGDNGYRLHLDDNGMLVGQWSIDWGDAGAPQVVSNEASVVHQYPADASLFTVIVTANGANGTYTLAPDTPGGGQDSSSTGSGTQNPADSGASQDLSPVLRVVADQETSSGNLLDLSQLGTFTHATVEGDFTYAIDWGDGSTADSGTAIIVSRGDGSDPLVGTFGGQHTYADAGTYYVAATIADPGGDSDTQTLCVVVNYGGPVLATGVIPIGTSQDTTSLGGTSPSYTPSTALSGTIQLDPSNVPSPVTVVDLATASVTQDSDPADSSPVSIVIGSPVLQLSTPSGLDLASSQIVVSGTGTLSLAQPVQPSAGTTDTPVPIVSSQVTLSGAIVSETELPASMMAAQITASVSASDTAEETEDASDWVDYLLARDTPDPHPTGDQPSDPSQMVALSNYVPSALPPVVNEDCERLNDGLQQIHDDIASNPSARPSYWVEVTELGGNESRLHLCDNGMLVNQWTIDWGDAGAPQVVSNQASIVHQYPADASLFTPIVTAGSYNGVFSLIPDTPDDGGDGETQSRTTPITQDPTDGGTIPDVGPTLRVANDQVAGSGQVSAFSPLGTFTHPPADGDFTFQIDWGDGSTPDTGTATIVYPGDETVPLSGAFEGQHTYAGGGVYYVAATVTDPTGSSDTQTLQVTVNQSVQDTSGSFVPEDEEQTPVVDPDQSSEDTTPTDDTGSVSPVQDGQESLDLPIQSRPGNFVATNEGQAGPITVNGLTSVAQTTQAPLSGNVLVTGDGNVTLLDGSQTTSSSETDVSSAVSQTSSTTVSSSSQDTAADTDSQVVALAESSGDIESTSSSFVLAMTTGVDTTTSSDAALLAAVRQALAMPAGTSVMSEDWARLTSLSADSNKVFSLSGLQYAVNLQSLSLVPSDFSDPGHLGNSSSFTTQFANLSKLTSLTLQRCGLDGTELTSSVLGSLTSLSSLDLRYNNIQTISSAIANVATLRTLSVYGNPLTASPRTGLAALAGKLLTVDIAPDHPEKVLENIDPTNPAATYTALAGAFYNLPVEIYEYLVNTIDFQPYQGAMKGPLAVLQTGRGNDWDTDSLLVQLFSAAGISTANITYVTTTYTNDSAILVPIQSAMQLVGVKTPKALYNVLWDAGLIPSLWDSTILTQEYPTALDASTQAGNAVYVSFQHAWLQWTPAQGTTFALDPTWKFRDFQTGLPGLLTTLSFDETTYLAQAQKGTPAEFYEGQVRSYLATNRPDLTIADVAYDGPIHPQEFVGLLTAPPYGHLNTPSNYSAANGIPADYEHRLRISVAVPQANNTVHSTATGTDANGNPTTTLLAATNVFTEAMVGQPVVIDMTSGSTTTPTEFLILSYNSSTHQVVVSGNATCTGAAFSVPGFSTAQVYNVPDIDLKRITISSESTGGSLTPTLNIEGNSSVASVFSVASGSPFYVLIDYIPGVPGLTGRQYSSIYKRNAGDYLAVGVDADQESSQMLLRARQLVNEQEIIKADSGSLNRDALIGGFLHLAAATYFYQTRQGEKQICDLTDAQPVYANVETALLSTPTSDPAQLEYYSDEQLPYMPHSMLLDVKGGWWQADAIDDVTSTAVLRDRMIGYTRSAMESCVWEELTNIPSMSTVKALQLANSQSISIKTLPDDGTVSGLLGTLDQKVRDSITNYLNQGYQVEVPTATVSIGNSTNANEKWIGVGYVIRRHDTTRDPSGTLWWDWGYIIQGGINGQIDDSLGGYAIVPPAIVNYTPPLATNFYVGEPINTANGDVMYDQTDCTIPNLGVSLSVARHYHSFNTEQTWSDRGMGDGWSFTYSDTLKDDGQNKVWFTDSGMRLIFKPKTGGGWITPPTIFGNLAQNGSNWVWTDKTGQTVTFNSNGLLTQVADRYGNGVAISRVGSTMIVSDLHDSLRRITFTFNSDSPVAHVTSISDFTGRTWFYSYDRSSHDSSYRLISVMAPVSSTTPLAMTRYAYYSDSALNNLLQSVTDPVGNRTLHAYYANRRGFLVTDAEDNSHSLSFNIYRNRSEFTDERGLTTYYTCDDTGNVTQELRPDRTTLAHTWQNALRMSDTDAFGQSTNYHYDAKGNLTESIDPLKNVVESRYTQNYADVSKTNVLSRPNPSQDPVTMFTTTPLTLTGNNSSSPARYAVSGLTFDFHTVLEFDFSTSSFTSSGDPKAQIQSIGFDSGSGAWVAAQQFQVSGTDTTTALQDFHDYASAGLGTLHYVIPIGQLFDWAIGPGLTPPTQGYLTFVNQTTDSSAQCVFSNVRIYEVPASASSYTVFGYNSDGSLQWSQDANDDRTTYTYPTTGSRGLPRSVTTPKGYGQSCGYTTWYEYNSAGQVTAQYTPVATTNSTPPTSSSHTGYIQQSFEYDTLETSGRGYLTSSTDGNGNTTSYTYDLLGNRTSQTQPDPDGSGPLSAPVTIYVYDAAGNLISTSLATANRPQTASTVYDKMGRTTKTINPDGTYMTAQYDPAGNLVAQTDAMGHVTQSVYDNRSREIATIRPDGTVVRAEYNGGGRVVGATDAVGNTSKYEYDKLGRTIAEVAPYVATSGAITGDNSDSTTSTFAFSTTGTWTASTSGTGGYDGGYVSASATPRSATWTFSQNLTTARYYEVFVTWVGNDANTSAAQYTVYDSASAAGTATVNQKTSPSLSTVFGGGGWYSLGRFFISGSALAVTLTGSGSGNLVADAVKIIEVTPTLYGYDAKGNLQYVTVDALPDNSSHSTDYTYDNCGRTLTVTQPDPDGTGAIARPKTYYHYDANGNLDGVTDARGAAPGTASDLSTYDAAHTTKYAYDESNRKTSETLPDPNGGSNTLVTSYFYDGNGNVTAVRTPGINGSSYFQTDYQYDNLSRKTKVTLPAPDSSQPLIRPTTKYAYDQSGNLASVTDANGNTTRYLYNLENLQTQVTDALGSYVGDPAHTTVATYDAVGNAIFVTDALGRTTAFQYDAMNRKVAATAPLPDAASQAAPQTTWQYDFDGNLQATTDPLGHTTWTLYDGWNRPTQIIDAVGNVTTTAYDPWNNVTAVTDPLGRRSQYLYDNLGRKITQVAPDPDDYTLTGGTNGSLAAPTTYYGYDPNGNLKYVTDTLNTTGRGDTSHTTWYFYDNLNRQVCIIDPRGNDYSLTSSPESITLSPQPLYSVVTAYDAAGNVSTVSQSVDGATTRTTTYLHDNLGRTKEEDSPPPGNGTYPKTIYTYDLNGNVLSTADALSHTTWTVYDSLNRPIRSVSALGSGPNDMRFATTTVYDAVGNVASVTDPAGNTTSYAYDRLNRQTTETDPLWIATSLKYDANGNIVQKTDRNGRVTQYVYDALNRPVQENWLNASGSVFHTIQTSYDAVSQVVGITESDTQDTSNGTRYQYAYDQDGRAIRARVAPNDLSQASASVYSGSLTSTTTWGTTSVPYLPLNLPTVRVGDVIWLHLHADVFTPTLVLWRPSGTGFYVSAPANGHDVTIQFTADDAANPTGTWSLWAVSLTGNPGASFTLDWQINPAVPTPLVELNYAYDPAGNLTSTTDSSTVATGTGGTVANAYDALSRLTQVKQTLGGTVNERANLGYYDDGSLHTINRYADDGSTLVATSTYGYDGMGRLTSLTHSPVAFVSTITPGYTFGFNAANNMTSMTSVIDGSTTFTNDTTGQLTSATYNTSGNLLGGSGAVNEAYTLDANGNRTYSTSTTSATQTAWTTGTGNRLLWDGTYTYTYDKEGNRLTKTLGASGATVRYTWDYRNRLVKVANYNSLSDAQAEQIATQTVRYTYDAFDHRIRETVTIGGATTYDYVIYEAGKPYLEFSDSDGLAGSAAPVVTDRYLIAAAVDLVLADDQTAANSNRYGQTPNTYFGTVWIMPDHEGTARDLVYYSQQTGSWLVTHRVFNAFGAMELTATTTDPATTVGTSVAYAGSLLDANTGLQDFWHRWYDAGVGQFICPDPSGFSAGDMNTYRYVQNSPMTAKDPTGLCLQNITTTASGYLPASISFTPGVYTIDGGSNFALSSVPTLGPWQGAGSPQVAVPSNTYQGPSIQAAPGPTIQADTRSTWQRFTGWFSDVWNNDFIDASTGGGAFPNEPYNSPVTALVRRALHSDLVPVGGGLLSGPKFVAVDAPSFVYDNSPIRMAVEGYDQASANASVNNAKRLQSITSTIDLVNNWGQVPDYQRARVVKSAVASVASSYGTGIAIGKGLSTLGSAGFDIPYVTRPVNNWWDSTATSSPWQYNMAERPGPLASMPGQPASNFAGGRYSIGYVTDDLMMYRGGDTANPNSGQWFSFTPPQSVAQVRIDSAVRPVWVSPSGTYLGASPVNTGFGVNVPSGSVIYAGPTGYQGGIYLGGQSQIQVFAPNIWTTPGVGVQSSWPLH